MKKKFILSIILLFSFALILTGCGSENNISSDVSKGTEDISNNLKENNMETKEKASTITGNIKIELYKDKAPVTSQNFIDLAKAGKYNNVPFHRIINDFMIQGGDFTNKNGTGGQAAKYHEGLGDPEDESTWVIPDEFGEGLKNEYGSISMANAGPNTGGSQFFIIDAKEGTPWLDGKHAVFGKVIEGIDIVESISEVSTDSMDKPVSPVIMKKVTIKEEEGNPVAIIEI
jgi:cyclophilin family peptidyl-prolyl cis-trans isomerase